MTRADFPIPYYHLDGVGELKHLDDILSIPQIAAIQWEPGAGKPPTSEWSDVYRKIAGAGKNYWLTGSVDSFFRIMDELHGTPYFRCCISAEEDELAKRLLSTR